MVLLLRTEIGAGQPGAGRTGRRRGLHRSQATQADG